MFHEWDSFYLLVGSAAAALIGLLLVVVTLTSNVEESRATLGAKVYMTPTVFHLGVVLVVSAMALTPHVVAHAAAAVLGLGAAIGFAYTALTAVRIQRRVLPDPPHWSDVWCYGVAPAALYAALAAAAVAVWTMPERGVYIVGATLVALLLVAIRNAWDLITFLAPRHDHG